ncbi:MAG: DNA polymerase domain-containing protein [Candidatus Woesearchaeota archaeon]
MDIAFRLQKITHSEKNPSVVKLYGRTIDNKKICVLDSFKDYILLDANTTPKSTVEKIQSEFETKELKLEIYDFPTNIIKVVKNIEKEQLLEELTKDIDIYEHDVPLEKKYLLEKKITYSKIYNARIKEEITDKNLDVLGTLESIEEIPDKSVEIKPVTLYFDIETLDDGQGINYTKNPILMISVISKNTQKILVAKGYPTKKDFVECYQSEAEMLEAFVTLIKKINPDIISGYNIKNFDIPYILKRCEMYDIPCNIGVDHTQIIESKSKQKYTIEGIQIFDMFDFLKRIMRTSITGSLSLDNVSQTLLDAQKDSVNLKELATIWTQHENLEKIDIFAQYCIKDSVLVQDLMKYFLYDIQEFTKMINCSREELSIVSFSEIVENYLIAESRNYGQIIPNKPKNEDIEKRKTTRLKGAFVFEPTPGVYDRIGVFDFRSLYPSLIESHNISKGRLSKEKTKNSLEVPDHDLYLDQTNKAFIPTIVEQIISRRGNLKELIKDTKDQTQKRLLASRIGTLKLIANSLYGYLGFYMARWYCFECAQAVTAFGRSYIHKTIDHFQNLGYEVLYSDTDSVFLQLKDKTLEDAQTDVATFNEKLPGLMNLEFEKEYKTGIFVEARNEKGAKKRYALIDTSNNLKVAGLAMVRGDWSPIAKKMQKETLQILLETKDTKKAIAYVKQELDALEKNNIEDFIIKTRLTKPTKDYGNKGPHVIVAEQLESDGNVISPGTLILFVITKSDEKKISLRAKHPKSTSVKALDFEYYINNQIYPVLENIFEVFGENITEINNKQTGLGNFF